MKLASRRREYMLVRASNSPAGKEVSWLLLSPIACSKRIEENTDESSAVNWFPFRRSINAAVARANESLGIDVSVLVPKCRKCTPAGTWPGIAVSPTLEQCSDVGKATEMLSSSSASVKPVKLQPLATKGFAARRSGPDMPAPDVGEKVPFRSASWNPLRRRVMEVCIGSCVCECNTVGGIGGAGPGKWRSACRRCACWGCGCAGSGSAGDAGTGRCQPGNTRMRVPRILDRCTAGEAERSVPAVTRTPSLAVGGRSGAHSETMSAQRNAVPASSTSESCAAVAMRVLCSHPGRAKRLIRPRAQSAMMEPSASGRHAAWVCSASAMTAKAAQVAVIEDGLVRKLGSIKPVATRS
eukprot:m.193218 g.193218  ORF g.193218 m.193218 type:complete len:354 (-) comp10069_c5_seq1:291-1352(-)